MQERRSTDRQSWLETDSLASQSACVSVLVCSMQPAREPPSSVRRCRDAGLEVCKPLSVWRHGRPALSWRHCHLTRMHDRQGGTCLCSPVAAHRPCTCTRPLVSLSVRLTHRVGWTEKMTHLFLYSGVYTVLLLVISVRPYEHWLVILSQHWYARVLYVHVYLYKRERERKKKSGLKRTVIFLPDLLCIWNSFFSTGGRWYYLCFHGC